MRTYLRSILLVAGLVLGFSIAGGCGGDEAERECETSEDCPDGQFCDASLGICEAPRTNSANNSTVIPTNNGNNNNGSGGNNTNNNDGNGPGGINSVPDPNQVVNDPQSSCTQEFDACDPSEPNQGSFQCVELEDGDGACFIGCDSAGEASNCASERYCLNSDNGPVCAPSECATDADCGTDTCIDLDNSYSFCLEAGSGFEGDPCQDGAGGQCQQGLACDAPTDGSGQCRTVCDPWGTGGDCGFGEECAMQWHRTGLCTPNQTTSGISTFDTCSPEGYWCSDATVCVAGGEDNFCLQYCRPGMSDCPIDAICDEHYFLGLDNIGACMPPCSTNEECGPDLDCVAQECRFTCTVDSDCCAPDSPDCGAECEAGYCI